MTFACAYKLNRAALEYEKKMHAVNDEITQILDEKIRSMEREIPILMAEVANAKKMERAAAAVDAASPGELFANHVFVYVFLFSTCAYESSSALCRISNDRLFVTPLTFESFWQGLHMLLVMEILMWDIPLILLVHMQHSRFVPSPSQRKNQQNVTMCTELALTKTMPFNNDIKI